MSPGDFSTVTEVPGNRATAEQLSMIHTRYRFAAEACRGKDVLEAACGPGRGLGYLARHARSVVGGDLTQALVDRADAHYGGRLKVVRMDAQEMPFTDGSFDVVILFEALYYLPDALRFLSEARRVLRPGGELLLCTPNREWAEFNPSPFSIRYHSADEMRTMLDSAGFDARVFAAYPAVPESPRGAFVAAVRRAAVSWGLVPKTMAGKAFLKRLFYGRLAELGPEIDESVPPVVPSPMKPGPVTGYKVLYVQARRRP